MPSLLSQISLQPQVQQVLTSAVASGRVSHAYLFSGPLGSGKLDAAYALAQAVLCEEGGCGSCISCKKVEIRKHPDLHVIAPEGTTGYLVEQIREVVSDSSRAPIQGRKKVYILDAVEKMGTSAANAFLKTLEEPSASVVLILLTAHDGMVLPTIVSRCQVVHFRTVPEREMAQEVAAKCGVTELVALAGIRAAGGSLELAQEFCNSEELQELRQSVLDVLESLDSMSSWDVLKASSALCVGGESIIDDLKRRQEEEMEQVSEFLQRGAQKQLETRNKRQVTAKTRDLFRLRCGFIESWLHDVLQAKAGKASGFVNQDYAQGIIEASQNIVDAGLLCACDAVSRCVRAIDYNVTLQLCMDTLLLSLREELYGPDCTGKTRL